MTGDHASQRRRMVADQLSARDITDERVLDAMGRVPRHEYVPEPERAHAYEDRPLPIGHGATISQPYIVALTTQELQLSPTDRVLDVGTGSGYQAALLAEMAAQVVSIERIEALADAARANLSEYGERVTVVAGDGTMGCPEHAPYDAICVAAAAPAVPPPLLDQLADGGRLVIPVARGFAEDLVRVTRRGDEFERESILPVRFVRLVGKHGY